LRLKDELSAFAVDAGTFSAREWFAPSTVNDAAALPTGSSPDVIVCDPPAPTAYDDATVVLARRIGVSQYQAAHAPANIPAARLSHLLDSLRHY
jgi:hypothetical protein